MDAFTAIASTTETEVALFRLTCGASLLAMGYLVLHMQTTVILTANNLKQTVIGTV